MIKIIWVNYLQDKKNKDVNIHKNEALKWKDKQALTLVECQN